MEQTLNGMEVDVETRNFVNGNTLNETPSGATALGQGSPKVRSNIRIIATFKRRGNSLSKCDNDLR